MTCSRIFLYFCLSFVGGIFLNSVGAVSQLLWLGFLILGILLISVFWPYKKLVIIGFCILFLAAGIWRFQIAELRITNNELRKFNDLAQKTILVGIVSAEPDIRETQTKLTVDNIKLVDAKHQSIKGKVLVTARKYPEYQYGDELKITGLLKTPSVFEDFNYKNFLAKSGIYSVMHRPQIELLERGNYRGLASVIYAKILDFKDKLRESIYQNLSPPQSSILGAMILGDQRKMSEELKEKLNITGVRHVVAISGMHVVILSGILMSLLIGLGLWRQQAFYFTIILIWLFIIMTGLQSSGIRAGIMGGLLLFAQYLGRLNSASRAVIFAAAGMLIINPLLLWFDIGFQLSFLAVMGIIYLNPVFQEWLKKIPEEQCLNLRSMISMTLSAQIFTLPILIYNFGYISLVALLTNILILPLQPLTLGAGFLFGLAGMVWQTLGWILSWSVWLLLTYLLIIVDWFSQLPWAVLFTGNLHWMWLGVAYLVLGLMVWRLNKGQKLKFLQY